MYVYACDHAQLMCCSASLLCLRRVYTATCRTRTRSVAGLLATRLQGPRPVRTAAGKGLFQVHGAGC